MTNYVAEPETMPAGLTPMEGEAAPITGREFATRIATLRNRLSDLGADAALIHAGDSLRYFSGIEMGASERMVAMLVLPDGPPIVICPFFEVGSLREEIAIEAEFLLWQEDESPVELVARTLKARGVRSLGIDPLLPYAWGRSIGDAIAPARAVDAGPAIDACRMVKSPSELALIQRAMDITLKVHAAAAAILRPGIRQSEVIRFIDRAHREMGTSGSYFCAVQFGRASAFPHGIPGDNALAEGELVLIDTGCLVEGYHSDITRTYAFGAVSDFEKEIWSIEHEAQQAAFDAAGPGIPCEDVDRAARQVIEKAGLGPDYQLPGLPHRTGHGIGLSIHEPPYLVRGDTRPLAQGMCFSNEPMIVVPDRFGIRLEDHFHITADGAQWFTPPQPSIDAPFG